MSSSEEVKCVDVLITEQANKITEKVNDKLDDLVEKIRIDTELTELTEIIEPIIEQITSSIVTVATDCVKDIVDKLGLKMISESSLTDDQKKLAALIYDTVKSSIEGFVNDPNVNNTIKITKIIGQIIKHIESTKMNGKVISGIDKKVVAIQLGRILIKEVMPDNKGEDEVLILYDLIAEPTLEAMIEVSRVVNVAVKELTAKCCPSILDFFKRVKASK
jgi:hypothetical protein